MSEIINDRFTARDKHTLRLLEEMCGIGYVLALFGMCATPIGKKD